MLHYVTKIGKYCQKSVKDVSVFVLLCVKSNLYIFISTQIHAAIVQICFVRCDNTTGVLFDKSVVWYVNKVCKVMVHITCWFHAINCSAFAYSLQVFKLFTPLVIQNVYVEYLHQYHDPRMLWFCDAKFHFYYSSLWTLMLCSYPFKKVWPTFDF